MAVPALIYASLNFVLVRSRCMAGRVPAATDTRLSRLGLLALVGRRAPASLKVFLLTLAILDDLGAIIIIALFYTADLHVTYLALALFPLAGMAWLNMRGAHRVAPILLLGVILWVLVLKSGVHATLAGVATAFFIPIKDRYGKSPLHSLENGLTPYVTFLIVPVFALANAGVHLTGVGFDSLTSPVTLGIIAGLVLGKQIGVFGATWLVVRMGWATLPHGANWLHLYGVAALAGIGFTMSLFVGGLSFEGPEMMDQVRLGVLTASIVSAIIGYLVLRFMTTPAWNTED